MRLFGNHPINNASGGLWVLSAILWVLEQWLPELFLVWGLNMPWGWITALLFAFWIGGQANQVNEGTNWFVRQYKRYRQFVEITGPQQQHGDDTVSFHAELAFRKHVRNIKISVEVDQAIVLGFGSDWAWLRWRVTSPIERVDCNKGTTERVRLIELRQVSESGAYPFNAYTGERPKVPAHDGGRFRVRVHAAAADHEPQVVEWVFLWKDDQLFPMPLETPDHDGGQAHKFKEGECVLWIAKEAK